MILKKYERIHKTCCFHLKKKSRKFIDHGQSYKPSKLQLCEKKGKHGGLKSVALIEWLAALGGFKIIVSSIDLSKRDACYHSLGSVPLAPARFQQA